jgi:hypothetical protein
MHLDPAGRRYITLATHCSGIQSRFDLSRRPRGSSPGETISTARSAPRAKGFCNRVLQPGLANQGNVGTAEAVRSETLAALDKYLACRSAPDKRVFWHHCVTLLPGEWLSNREKSKPNCDFHAPLSRSKKRRGSFVSQGVCRVQARGAVCGQHPEDQPHRAGDAEGDDDRGG